MKLRMGFVSNSSTTAFICLGWSQSDFPEKFDEIIQMCQDELGDRYDLYDREHDYLGKICGLYESEGDLHPESGDRATVEISEEQRKTLKELVVAYNLPTPKEYFSQYYNG